MKTLGDLGILPKKKEHRNWCRSFQGENFECNCMDYGYNSAIDEISKIPIKDILAKLDWDEGEVRKILYEHIRADKGWHWEPGYSPFYADNSKPLEKLASALSKELPNMLKEEK